jgi:RimJ/RimL family protein N-acetyltransferase
MYRIVCDDDIRVNAFLRTHVPGMSLPDYRAIGLEKEGRIIAGVVYENFNDSNVWFHLAIEPGERLTKNFLTAMHDYPFGQLGLTAMRAYVRASHEKAKAFMNGLGFMCEAALEGAGDKGEDMLVYVLKKEWARYGLFVRR